MLKRWILIGLVTIALIVSCLMVRAQSPVNPVPPTIRVTSVGHDSTITVGDSTSISSASDASDDFWLVFPTPYPKTVAYGAMSMFVTIPDTLTLSLYALPGYMSSYTVDTQGNVSTATIRHAEAIFSDTGAADTLWFFKRTAIYPEDTSTGAKGGGFATPYRGSGGTQGWGPCDGLKFFWAITTTAGSVAPADSAITFRPRIQ